jgi:3-dehydroquinate synthase class II
VVLFVTVLVGCAFSAAAQADKATATAKGGEEFFIISSVDMAKKQLLLKEPTEITEILQVNDNTRYTDKNGKTIQFADLRAGDTVFIRVGGGSGGKVAVSIRKGPMTVGELRLRYLK